MISNEQIMLYIDGLLSEHETAEVDAYLLAHPEKSREVTRLREQDVALRSIGREILDDPIPSYLLDIIKSAKFKDQK